MVQNLYAAVAGLVGIALLARVLAPADFGVVALAAALVAILQVMSDLGFAATLVKRADRSPTVLATAFWINLSVTSAAAAAIAALSPLIAEALAQPRLAPILAVLAVQLPISSLALIPTACLTAALKVRSLALRQIVAQTTGIVVAVAAAHGGLGPWSLALQAITATSVGVVVLWLALPWRPRLEFSRGHARDLMRSGLPIMGTSVVHVARDNGITIVVGAALGGHAVGVWTIAVRLCTMVAQIFSTALNMVALPIFARLRDHSGRLHGAYQQTVLVSNAVNFPLLIGVSATSATAIPLLFGDQWQGAVPVAQIYGVSVAITAMHWLDPNLWWAIEKPRVEFTLTCALSVAHVAVAIFTAHLGLTALAIALLARSLFSVPVRIAALTKKAKVPLRTFRTAPRAFACALAMGAAVYLTDARAAALTPIVRLLLDLTIGTVTYLLLSMLVQRDAVQALLAHLAATLGRGKDPTIGLRDR